MRKYKVSTHYFVSGIDFSPSLQELLHNLSVPST